MIFEYLPEEDIYIIYGKLPEGVEGFCKEIDSYRFACIDESLEGEEKYRAIIHELCHLRNNDLYREFDDLEVI